MKDGSKNLPKQNNKILIVASIFPPDPGGPALHAKKQFEGFPEIGFQTGLVALAHYRKWPIGIRHILFFLKLIKVTRNYNLVYVHDSVGAGFPAFFAARFYNKKIIVRVGGDLSWEREAERNKTNLSMYEWYESGDYRFNIYYVLSKFLLKRVNGIIVPSKNLLEVYTKYYSISVNKIILIPNPFSNLGPINNLVAERSIVYASRLVSYKNLSFVLKVIKNLLNKYSDLKFVILGDGPEASKLMNLSKELSIDHQVIFKGIQSQEVVMKEISKSLFTIAPALTEFNPNYVLQGISLGKPFLISKENGFSFTIPNSFIFDPRSELDLKEHLDNLLNKNNYIEAVNKVKEINFQFDWHENLQANANFIQKIL